MSILTGRELLVAAGSLAADATSVVPVGLPKAGPDIRRWLSPAFRLLSGRVMPGLMGLAAAGMVHAAPARKGQRMEEGNAASPPMNVLFIAVDDLRPTLGVYGDHIAKTPNIDALARQGMVFTQAYSQIANCNPSRSSLLTGRRPDTTQIFDLSTHFRSTLPDAVTLPEYFKKHGYFTQSFGKVFHNAIRGGLEDPQSWSVSSTPSAQDRNDGKAWAAPDVPDDQLEDGRMATLAVATLPGLKVLLRDKPFFLAVGFRKPHLPFLAPKRYYDLYPLEQMPLALNPAPPRDVPPVALNGVGELKRYDGMPKAGRVPDPTARELVRGYYASVSYTDAQVGRVLAELDRLGLRESTIIVLWSDHGWHLGEHEQWTKHTNFEESARVPLIISVPGQKNRGASSNGLVELVDLYPTLCELVGFKAPPGLEGLSLAPLLEDPNRPWKRAAFTQYPRDNVMGHSMRTERYRYAEWAEPNHAPVGVELYDYQMDPRGDVNLAGQPEYKALIEELSKQLHAGWRSAMPADKQ